MLAPDRAVRRLLLEHVHRFGLALQLENKDWSLQTRSLVPAVLKDIKKPVHHDVKWSKATDTHQVLGRVSTLDFVPHNLFPQLLLQAYRYAPCGDSAVCCWLGRRVCDARSINAALVTNNYDYGVQ